MIRAWIAVALLASSWHFGLGYFLPASPSVCSVSILAATILLSGVACHWPTRSQMILAVVLLIPSIWLMPLPHKVIPLLLAVGLSLKLFPMSRQWLRRWGDGLGCASIILLAQSVVLHLYSLFTARSHELPAPLTWLVGLIPRLFGIDTATDGSTIAVRSIQEQRKFQATWELLCDPATLAFFVGGCVLLVLVQPVRETDKGVRSLLCEAGHRFFRTLVLFTLAVLAWAPIRAGFLIALAVHRALRADAFGIPNVADVLVNSWIHVALLAIPVLIAIRLFFKHSDCDLQEPSSGSNESLSRPQFVSMTLFAAGIAVLTFLYGWDPVGGEKSGRIMFVERHSTWEPTTEPYRDKVYGEAGSYNYAAAFEYCGQHFEMLQLLESDPIDEPTLSRCDVLVIKTPTARYTEKEVAAVVRFVEQGGSLLVIGDHTNVFNMNTYLNDVTRHFGFTFRNDLLFQIGTPYKQFYRPAVAAHPIVQHMPPMNFAVSCSIDPGCSLGRMVIRNAGLWNLQPDYAVENYHPQAEYRAEMQYGSWCQLWSTRHGKGRVLAFGDSTLFSNFCVFQPGKIELLTGMLNWLNRSSVFDRLWIRLLVVIPLGVVGIGLVVLGLRNGRRHGVGAVTLVSVGFAGWFIAAATLVAANRGSMSVPAVKRPMPHVVIDRRLSEVPLFTGAFPDNDGGNGYGMLEQWIPRVGNYISRETGNGVFDGDGLVIICPTHSVTDDYRQRLMKYVKEGGRLLVIDSIESDGSTANSLLRPFGLSSRHNIEIPADGVMSLTTSELAPPIQASCEIEGGIPIASIGATPVAAQTTYGEGTVTAIGFGYFFNDAHMGQHWLIEPDADVLTRYEILYSILRSALME